MDQEPLLLIVEDDNFTRGQLKNYFEDKDYLLRSAMDAEQALEILKYQEVDIVILDIIMPGMDGFDLLEKIRENYSELELPVIMSTVRDKSEDIVKALHQGANDYVTKPVDLDVVEARLETHLKIKELKAKNRRLARHDSLTVLLDRRILLDELDARFNGNAPRPVLFGLLDLDHFKSINDQHGHLVGDEVLEEVGEILSNTFDETGVAGRYGGEEFGVILDQIKPTAANELLESLREEIASIDLDDLPELDCSVSIGYTVLTENEDFGKEDLIYHAN
jgi:diguanylate cyclase (GGDEF)-like protein